MGSPTIFKGSNVKQLKDDLEFFTTRTSSNVRYVTNSTINPQTTATAGLAGSILVDQSGNIFIKQDDATSTNWEQIATGAKDLDIFYSEDFELIPVGDFTSGDNATFDNGGTLSGTLAKDTTNEIAGSESLLFTQAAGSLDDWVKSEAITLDDKQKGNFAVFSIYSEYDGDDSDIRIIIWDDTNNQELNLISDVFTQSSISKRHEVGFFIPATCNDLAWGFHVKVLNSSAVLRMDDAMFTTKPLLSKELLDIQELRVHTSNGYGSTNTVIRRFSTTVSSTGDTSIFTFNQDATNGDDITIDRNCKMSISYTDNFSASAAMGISLNSAQLTTGINTITTADRISSATSHAASDPQHCSWEGDLVAGDVIRFHTAGTSDGTAARTNFTISAEVEALHVVTPAKSNLTPWESYVPVTQGIGTPTIDDARWRQVGDSIELQIQITNGTVTATELQIGLPIVNGTQYTVSSVSIPIIKNVGEVSRVVNTVLFYTSLATGGDSFLNIGRTGSGTTGLLPLNGSVLFGSSNKFTINALVPITQLDDPRGATFLAAIPVPLVGYVKDIQAQNSGAVASVASYTARRLNTVEGDTFFTLSANRITLPRGKYSFDAYFFGGTTAGNLATKIVEDPAGSPSDLAVGNTSSASDSVIHAVSAQAERTSSFTIEFQTIAATAVAGGFANPVNLDQETYAVIKIVKWV